MEEKSQIPKIMKGAFYEAFGDPFKVLEIRERQVPAPSPTECLVRVHAAAINPVDEKFMNGAYAMVAKIPCAPGMDVSGVVVKTGERVKNFKVGDEIWAANQKGGTFSEYVAIDQQFIGQKPKNLSFKDAASFPCAGLTSYQALLKANVSKGKKILILGGSGGCGSLAVQFAKHGFQAGHVAAVCSSANADWVKSLGADQVIDYKSQNWWEVLKGQKYDVVYDCVGGYEPWEKSAQLLGGDGIYVTICGDGGESMTVGKVLRSVGGLVNRKFWSFFGNPTYSVVFAETKRVDQLNVIKQWVESGAVKSVLTQTFPLNDVAKLFAQSASQRTRGKAGLIVVPE